MRFLTVSTLAFLAACGTDGAADDTNTIEGDDTIIGVADAAGDFETLLAAVDAAGLTTTLQGDGPFTVFAPTDAAFAALPDGTVDALLNDIDALTDILTYHVVSGDYDAAAVSGESLITTLNNVDVKVNIDGGVFVNEAEVTTADVFASNGTIHIIDQVLIPPPTIAEIAAGDSNFSTLVAALTEADLVDTLAGDGPFTVFAPTNDAFAKIPSDDLNALLADKDALTSVLLYHVVADRVPAEDVIAASSVPTVNGADAAINVDSDGATVAGARITATDIPARNGVIHIIDDVMLPPAQ